MQGNIIAVDIPIYRKGEINFFQVNLPDDVKGITYLYPKKDKLAKALSCGTLSNRDDGPWNPLVAMLCGLLITLFIGRPKSLIFK